MEEKEISGKIILEFDPTNLEHVNQIKQMLDYRAPRRVLEDFSQELRKRYKYCEYTEEAEKLLEELRDVFYELLREENVELD